MVVSNMTKITLYQGHVFDILRSMPGESVHCVVRVGSQSEMEKNQNILLLSVIGGKEVKRYGWSS
jgi:hypothetical protein